MPKHLWRKRSFFCSPLGREGWRCNIEERSFLRIRGKSRFAKSSIYCSTEMLLIFFRCVASRRNQADYSAVFRKCRMRHCSRNFIKIAVLALRPGCANRNPNTISACGRVHLNDRLRIPHPFEERVGSSRRAKPCVKRITCSLTDAC